MEAEGSQAAHSSTGSAAFCAPAVKATPGAQAKQTGLVTFGESSTCQASCFCEVCVSFQPWLSWQKAWSHQEHVIPCNCAPAPGAGALGASPSSTFLRGLLASLPHPQVLRPQLHPAELGVPQALYRACEIRISALISPTVLQGCQKCSQCQSLSLIPSASQLCAP